LFSRFWIIFTIIIWNSLSGRFSISSLLFGLVGIYPVPLPAGYSSASSSWLYCCVWGVLSVFWQFVEFSLLWSFLAVGGIVQVAFQGFLVREACVSVLVEKKESPKGERAVKSVISLPSKKWVLKIGFLKVQNW